MMQCTYIHRSKRQLENDLHAEQMAIRKLRNRIQFSQDNNDYGTEELLKDILEDYEDIAHELDHYLKDSSLERQINK
jgi:starvation-inducible DNA-binding protein